MDLMIGVLLLPGIIGAPEQNFYQQQQDIPKGQPLNILLLGTTGHGKSALGNLILGKQVFESRYSGQSVTKECRNVTEIIGSRRITVMDTPGTIDLKNNAERFFKLLATSIAWNRGEGYHAFLIVLSSIVKVTQEEKDAIKFLNKVFGDMFFEYTVFVYTHGDGLEERQDTQSEIGKLKAFYEFLHGQDKEFSGFLHKASYRAMLVNNREKCQYKRKDYQVEIIDMIDKNIQRHSSVPYINEHFEYATRQYRTWRQWIMHGFNAVLSYLFQKLCDVFEAVKRWFLDFFHHPEMN